MSAWIPKRKAAPAGEEHLDPTPKLHRMPQEGRNRATEQDLMCVLPSLAGRHRLSRQLSPYYLFPKDAQYYFGYPRD